jgi:hypothetical protein
LGSLARGCSSTPFCRCTIPHTAMILKMRLPPNRVCPTPGGRLLRCARNDREGRCLPCALPRGPLFPRQGGDCFAALAMTGWEAGSLHLSLRGARRATLAPGSDRGGNLPLPTGRLLRCARNDRMGGGLPIQPQVMHAGTRWVMITPWERRRGRRRCGRGAILVFTLIENGETNHDNEIRLSF